MDAEKVVSQLIEKKKIGFRIGGIEAWGQPLARAEDSSLELSGAKVRGDLLVLTLTPTAGDGGSANNLELVVETPGKPGFSKDAIELASATYLRLGEWALTATAGKVQFWKRGKPEDGFDSKGAPALVLRRDPFVP